MIAHNSQSRHVRKQTKNKMKDDANPIYVHPSRLVLFIPREIRVFAM